MEKIFRPSPKSFKKTFCVFQEVGIEKIENLQLQYDSKSGSKYYYSKEGMYRLSNHWGRLANSKWRLEPMEPETDSKFKSSFHASDEMSEKIFIIPPSRNRYLSEISETIRKYNKWADDQSDIAQKMYQLDGTKSILNSSNS